MIVGSGFSVSRFAYRHNSDMEFRKTLEHVDPERTKDNIIIIDRLKGQKLEDFINQGMQKWIDKYNEGKKPSRQIKTTYTEWHRSQKNYQQGKGDIKFAYEAVISYGGKDDIGRLYRDPKTRQKIREESEELFRKWVKDMQEKFPHMKIIFAICHYDEATPHMHVAFMPLAFGDYQRGLQCRISVSKALEQDGIEKLTDRKDAMQEGGFQLTRFYKKFRHEIMNPDLIRRGYEIKEEEHGKTHIDSAAYPQVQKEIEKKAAEKAKAIDLFTDKIDYIADHEQDIVRGKSKTDMIVKKVKKGKDTLVLVKEQDFNSAEITTNIEQNKRDLEFAKEKIEAEHKKIQSALLMGADEALKQENADLQKTILEKDDKILSLKREIENHQTTIQNQKLAIKYLLTIIQDTIPRMFNQAINAVRNIMTPKQEREERTR